MPEVDFAPSPHEEAAGLIESKAVVSREVFDGLLPEVRGRAFTITGISGADVLQRVRDGIASLPRGAVWDDVKGDVVKELEPFLGEGSDARAELLLRTHGFQAFQAANYRVGMEDADTTHWQYLATEDSHVRATHLALNGIILPKDDPFWEKHFPPWEWGCRCRGRPMNPDLVAEAATEDKQRAPDDQLVLEGPAARKLREDGTLLRNGQAYNVTAPSDESGSETAYRWHPGDLRLSVGQLEQRYDKEVWKGFKLWAETTSVGPQATSVGAQGETVWEWLKGAESVVGGQSSVVPEPTTATDAPGSGSFKRKERKERKGRGKL